MFRSIFYVLLVFTCFIIQEINWRTQSSGNMYRVAASASNLEQGRLQKLKELCDRNQGIRSSSNKVFFKLDVGDIYLKVF